MLGLLSLTAPVEGIWSNAQCPEFSFRDKVETEGCSDLDKIDGSPRDKKRVEKFRMPTSEKTSHQELFAIGACYFLSKKSKKPKTIEVRAR